MLEIDRVYASEGSRRRGSVMRCPGNPRSSLIPIVNAKETHWSNTDLHTSQIT